MTIKAQVKHSLLPGVPWEVTLPEPIATIGRQASCALVLADPEKHVSRIHATVELRGCAYFLTVTSRVNPVLMNGQPCEPGTGVELRDGAQLIIHPFELSLHITPPATAAAPFNGRLCPPAPTPTASPHFSPPAAPFDPPHPATPAVDDPFGWLDGLSSKPGATGSAPADPFGLDQPPPPSPSRRARLTPDPFQREYQPPAQALVEDLVPGLGDMGRAGNGAAMLDAAPLPVDPLALLGAAPPPMSGLESFASAGAAIGSATVSADDFLGIGLGASTAGTTPLVDLGHHRPTGSSNLDHVHDFNLPFQPPPLFTRIAPGDGLGSQAPLPGGLMPRAPVTTAPPEARATSVADSANAPIAAFLEGLGASNFTLPPDGEAAFFRQAGEIMRAAVHSLITLLLARSAIKKELRAADRTMLAAHNNNPLKFMEGTDDAVRFLFDPAAAKVGAFLPPVQAIADACSELLAHEMGLVAGMRAAVAGSIKHFDPALMEQAAGKAGGLVLNRKGKLWDMHTEQYARMERDMADNLDHLFEGDFLRAYSEQVRRMQQKG